ncbi:UNVERIFIED_ORG: hypothetical protein E4P37_13845 [Bacillus sp. AZ43]
MPDRGPLPRLLRSTGVLCAGALAVVGGLGLRGPGLVAVGLAGALAACTAVGIVRDTPGHDRRSLVEAAVQAAAWTVAALLALAGVAALAGGAVALLVAVVVAGSWLGLRALRSRGATPRPAAPPVSAAPAEVRLLPTAHAAEPVSPARLLDTAALGREWQRTSAALAGHPAAIARATLARRRAELLDELERRDPAGFARWLADGPTPGSDPAAYVQGRPVQEDPTAGTDAA